MLYDQYDGVLNCSGQKASKRFSLNEASASDSAVNLDCCRNPTACLTGTPGVSNVGASEQGNVTWTYLNNRLCARPQMSHLGRAVAFADIGRSRVQVWRYDGNLQHCHSERNRSKAQARNGAPLPNCWTQLGSDIVDPNLVVVRRRRRGRGGDRS